MFGFNDEVSSFQVLQLEERTLMSAAMVEARPAVADLDDRPAIHVEYRPATAPQSAAQPGDQTAPANLNRLMQQIMRLGARLQTVRMHIGNLRLEAGEVSHAQGENWDPSRWNDIYDHLIERRFHQAATLAKSITLLEKRAGIGSSSGAIQLVNFDLQMLKLDARTERDAIRDKIPQINGSIKQWEFWASKGVPGAEAEVAKLKQDLAKHQRWLPTIETVRSEWSRELPIRARG